MTSFVADILRQIFKPDPKDAHPEGVSGVRDEWFKQIIIAQIVLFPSLSIYIYIYTFYTLTHTCFAGEYWNPLDAASAV
jgi:hypothetical protein